MSWQPGQDPIPGDKSSCDAIEQVIVPRARDLGGFEVRRALPSAQKRMVGRSFFDQMGPARIPARQRHRRAPAPAYRARHRDLSVRRRDVASRQPRHVGGDQARRGEPDDRRPRHRAFGARARRGQAGDAQSVRHPGVGGAAQGGRGDGASVRTSWRATSCRAS